MMIHQDKCAELNWLTPKSYETQYSYILRLLLEGFTLTTRTCRYIGIHNLHSIIPKFYDREIELTHYLGQAECPFTKEIPERRVNIVYMTPEQRQAYWAKKTALATA